MKPAMDDVTEMVSALMGVVSGIERAKRQGPANTLTFLYLIASREQTRPSELSQELGLHQSSATRQVQALEAAGYVRVAADPDDGRSCLVSITDPGREEMARLSEIGLGRFAAFVEDWDPEEVRTLGRLLRKLENSKAEVARREARPEGRQWQRKRDEL